MNEWTLLQFLLSKSTFLILISLRPLLFFKFYLRIDCEPKKKVERKPKKTYHIIKNAKVDEDEKTLKGVEDCEQIMKHIGRWNERQETKRPRDSQNWQ